MADVMATGVSIAVAETRAILTKKLKGLILIAGSNYFPCDIGNTSRGSAGRGVQLYSSLHTERQAHMSSGD